MDIKGTPTKGNLIAAKNTLRLSVQGYELMDKKRNILIKEIMSLTEEANKVQEEIDVTFGGAYEALQNAVTQLGSESVGRISCEIEVDDGIAVKMRSVMGTLLPMVIWDYKSQSTPPFNLGDTTSALDETYMKFNKVKELTLKLAMIENTAYRLALNIKKTSKRANALKNITIPKYEEMIKYIQNTLEERERDEFTRLKMVKELKVRANPRKNNC
ncbi:MAG: V-type ATP synthase subunit D [Defluviitaleaceae bacterium]|nr:V-type ATP synthase subunit D [Defluviitaleaceae bacterium]